MGWDTAFFASFDICVQGNVIQTMDYKGFRKVIRQVSSTGILIGMAFLAITNTIMILISDEPVWEKLKLLGFAYLGPGIIYGMFRLYRRMFPD